MKIKKICTCGSFEVDVFSAIERKVDIKESKVPIVEITYVCNKCGNVHIENHYLYKR